MPEFGYVAKNKNKILHSFQGKVLEGLFLPWCENCGNKELIQAVGVIGAVIMPHNLYLHSALVKSRNVDRRKNGAMRQANMYFFIEAAIALLVCWSN